MKWFAILIYLITAVPFLSIAQQKSILIFSKTTGFRHESIPTGVTTIKALLQRENIAVTHTEDANAFNSSELQKFDAVIFLSTTGDLFNDAQKVAFQQFIQSGKGYVGIHAASDTEHNWAWYGRLVGGYFASHPHIQEAQIEVKNRNHQSTKYLPSVWLHKDEWYDFKDVKAGLHILMELNETSYQGGKMGKFHPIAWFQEFDGGRAFYTGLGHTHESFHSDNFKKHILGGIQYVLGLK